MSNPISYPRIVTLDILNKQKPQMTQKLYNVPNTVLIARSQQSSSEGNQRYTNHSSNIKSSSFIRQSNTYSKVSNNNTQINIHHNTPGYNTNHSKQTYTQSLNLLHSNSNPNIHHNTPVYDTNPSPQISVISNNHNTIQYYLTLTGIDPIDLIDKFINNDFIPSEPTNKVKAVTKQITYDLKTGTDSRESEVYRYRDNNNHHVRIVTKDHQLFRNRIDEIESTGKSVHNITGKIFSYLPQGKPCKWCRRMCDLNSSSLPRSNLDNSNINELPKPTLDNPNAIYPIGLPIGLSIEEDTGRLIFTTISYFCCFGCAFAYFKQRNQNGRVITDPKFIDSERLLRLMLLLSVGSNSKLIATREYDLLDINGGPLGEAQYFHGSIQYIPVTNLIMLPAKEMYSEMSRLK